MQTATNSSIAMFQSTRLREARQHNYNLLKNKEKTAPFRYSAEISYKRKPLVIRTAIYSYKTIGCATANLLGFL